MHFFEIDKKQVTFFKTSRMMEERKKAQSTVGIKIEDDWYDVTDFVDRHPGGTLILEYLGRDATDIFLAFHLEPIRALKRVRKIDGGPPTSAIEPEPAGTIEEKLQTCEKSWNGSDDDLARDFRFMLQDLRAEGYFKPGDLTILLQKVTLVALFLFSSIYLALRGTERARFYQDPDLLEWRQSLILSSLSFALFLQQSGFLMHDFMHNQWFRNRKIDQLLGTFFGTICFGVSSTWWRDEHFVHHVFTNTLEPNRAPKDPQMKEDVWAQDPKLLQFFDGSIDEAVWTRSLYPLPLRWVNRIINIQAFLWLPLTVGVGRIGVGIASFTREPRTLMKILQLFHHSFIFVYLWAAFPTWKSALLFCYMLSFGQGILHIQLLLSHYERPWQELHNTKTSVQWYRRQITSTMNIAPCFSTRPWRKFDSKMLDIWDECYAPCIDDWFHGGLNLHIEHHLAPTLPRSSLRECRRRVRKICNKHNVYYHERHFFQGVWDILVQMNKVGWDARFS
jgi:fatty acid desaturase